MLSTQLRYDLEVNCYPILSLKVHAVMFPSGSLGEGAMNSAHPAHGILLWRLEIQICHQFLNPLSCDTFPCRRLLRLPVAHLFGHCHLGCIHTSNPRTPKKWAAADWPILLQRAEAELWDS